MITRPKNDHAPQESLASRSDKRFGLRTRAVAVVAAGLALAGCSAAKPKGDGGSVAVSPSTSAEASTSATQAALPPAVEAAVVPAPGEITSPTGKRVIEISESLLQIVGRHEDQSRVQPGGGDGSILQFVELDAGRTHYTIYAQMLEDEPDTTQGFTMEIVNTLPEGGTEIPLWISALRDFTQPEGDAWVVQGQGVNNDGEPWRIASPGYDPGGTEIDTPADIDAVFDLINQTLDGVAAGRPFTGAENPIA